MKKQTIHKLITAHVLGCILMASPSLIAANLTKAATGTDLTAGASWTGSAAPGASDVATWDTSSLGAGLTLNSGTPSWLGIKVNAGAAQAISIGSGGTLTLGNSGIDMSAATVSLTNNAGLTLGGGSTWNVAGSKTLALSGTFTRSAGATLVVGSSSLATASQGAVICSPSLVNGVIPWAAALSSGTAANASSAGYTFATVTSGNIVPYTAATSTTFGGTLGTATVNYDQTGAGNSTTRGVALTGNTVRNIATSAATLVFSTGSLTVNGLMNAGVGTLAIGSAVNQGALIIGANNELDLLAETAGITINSPVSGSAKSVVVAGPNTVTLAGTNTFTGNLYVNSGTLAAGFGLGDPGVFTTQGSALGNIGTAVARSIIVNGGTLSLTAGNTLGTGGSANTLSAITLVVNSGGVFQSGANAAGAGWWNKIGAINLNGGTIHVGSGANNSNFEGLALIGNVTVAGTTASTIDNLASSDTGYNAIHLGQNATANQSITFNVADVTGNPSTDLTISAKLINTSSTLTPSGLTKTGAGKLTLSNTNTYTGNTVISNGVVALSGNGSLTTSNIVVSSGAAFDVSAITFTLAANQGLSGNGVVTGNVVTATSSGIIPGGLAAGNVGTLTFTNNLDMSSGGNATFDLSATAGSGNDQVVVGGNLALSSSSAIHINAISGALDTADYVLFSVAGSTTMATMPALNWDGSVPANSANYTLQKLGTTNVVLHYSAASAPTITTASATPNPAYRNQAVVVSASVNPGSGSIVSVTVDASQIGGSSTANLIQDTSMLPSLVYTNTVIVAPNTTLTGKSLTVTATDNSTPTPLMRSYALSLSIAADNATWNGAGSDAKWTSNGNWQNSVGPGYFSDSVTFSGTTQLTPDMNTNYSITSLTFDGTAGAFVIGSSAGSVLTNSGGIVNNSSAAETLNVPVVLTAAQTFNTASGNLTLNTNLSLGANTLTFAGAGNLTLAGAVSGTAGFNVAGSGALVLSNANTFTGSVNITNGTVVLANATAAANNTISFPANSTGTLDIQSDSDNITITNIAGNSGASTSPTIASDRATSGAGINHTVGVLLLAQATLNITAGPNVSGGNPKITTGPMSLSSGVSAIVGINPTTANISIARITALSVNKTLTLGGTSSGNEITGVIDNATKAIGLVKNNSSTWTLSGANTYISGTTLSAGQLNINNNSALGTGAFTISGGTIDNTSSGNVTLGAIAQNWNGDFTYAGSVNNLSLGTGAVTLNTTPQVTVNQNTLSVSGIIAGSGQGLTKTGNGTLQLSGANTYSGATTINGGKLVSTTSGSSASPFTVSSGGTNGILLVSAGGAWTNTSSVTQNSSSELDIDFSTFTPSTITAPMNVGTLNINATTILKVVGQTLNFAIGQTYPLVTWSTAGPADTNGITLIMPTRLTGHLAVSGNTLSLTVDSNTGPLSWNTGNGTWDTSTPNWVDALNVSSTFIDGGDAVVFGSASGASGNPTVTLNTALSPTGVTMNSASHNYTISGTGGINGIGSLTVQNGTLSLATSNYYSGGTIVSGGALQISGSGTLGATTGALTVSGGTVDLGSTTQAVGVVALTSGAIQNGTLTNSGFTISNATATTLKIALAGSGGLTKRGNGTLTITNQNFFTGSVFANSGTIVMDSGSAINNGGSYSSIGSVAGDNATMTIKGNGTFTNTTDFNVGDVGDSVGVLNIQDTASLTVANLFVGSANAVGSTASGVINQTGGTVSQTSAAIGAFAIGGRTSTNGVGVYNISGGTLTTAGGIRVGGSGTGTLNISGSALLNLNGGLNIARLTNSTGTVNLNGGTVMTINIASSTSMNCTNNFNGSTVKPTTNNAAWISGLTRCNVRNGGAIIDTAGWNVTSLQALLHSDIAGDSAVDGGVTKNGLGTLTLSNTNTYTGNTTVNAGTLQVLQASIATNSTVNIAASAKLQIDFAVTNQIGALVLGGLTQPSGVYSSNTSPAFIAGAGSLLVPATGPSGAGTITNTVSGSTMTLSWPSGQGWKLQQQTNSLTVGLGTNWIYVTDGSVSSTNITIDANSPNVFYRLVYP